jgi:type IV secretion system protein VirB10
MNSATSDPMTDTFMRPVVARARTGPGALVFGGIALGGALGLFIVLEARRADKHAQPTEVVTQSGGGTISAPPELDIPALVPQPQIVAPLPVPPSAPAAALQRARPQGRWTSAPPSTAYYSQSGAANTQPVASESGLVFQAPVASLAPGADTQAATRNPDRVKATRFANPATTLPKGAIIQAVLETALNSTQAGAARAIISRDVRGFDGSRILIPRGSRLYGEYKADLSAGQNRALIQWQRLMRPDGSMIALDSPSADPLGRAGVKSKVNTHFFERFGGAILQSSLDLGVTLATRRISNGTVIVGLPGSTQSVAALTPERVKPTLKVAQGTPVSVFVARDLDFTEVEQP